MAVLIKKMGYPKASTNTPENPANHFGAKSIIELNKAYWVAEYWTFVSEDKNAIKAAVAIPELRLSAEITQTNPVKSWPWVASQANSKLLTADNTAPKNKMRITPNRSANTPPIKAPSKVMMTPNTLLTAATSSLV